ncbi:Cytochrome c biogenesis protein transmembrane region [Candidatus Desulfosporosinus infrequens]|uniref:Cytochrome c biogenesis protein transmembrane region n=1 Tax=Candidatus Desulfosporosinus infrequens TaxID=2043169 RepID=A0A2U3LJ55_9FIRM|nr:Cytochrome c biogenesis protein transmembrane region [Candidatus Desulfosporosinus infrequens]
MPGGIQPTLWLAFIAGLLSFLSPCCLPLYPVYISYISGITFFENGKYVLVHRVKALTHAFFFVFGFSIVFLALGLSASVLGQAFITHRALIRIIGGCIVVLMGLSLSGLLTPHWLMREKRWEYHQKKVGYGGSILVGISFAAGWTPCIGPILASVLVMSAAQPSAGLALILAYIAGFSIPFFGLAFTLSSVRKLVRYGALLAKLSGYLLIGLGILLITNLMTTITVGLIRLYGGFIGF